MLIKLYINGSEYMVFKVDPKNPEIDGKPKISITANGTVIFELNKKFLENIKQENNK